MLNRRLNAGHAPLTFIWLHAFLSLLAVSHPTLGSHSRALSFHRSVSNHIPRATVEEDMAVITRGRVDTIVGGITLIEDPASIGAWYVMRVTMLLHR